MDVLYVRKAVNYASSQLWRLEMDYLTYEIWSYPLWSIVVLSTWT